MSKRGALSELTIAQRPDLPALGHPVMIPDTSGAPHWYRVWRATGERVVLARLTLEDERELLARMAVLAIGALPRWRRWVLILNPFRRWTWPKIR